MMYTLWIFNQSTTSRLTSESIVKKTNLPWIFLSDLFDLFDLSEFSRIFPAVIYFISSAGTTSWFSSTSPSGTRMKFRSNGIFLINWKILFSTTTNEWGGEQINFESSSFGRDTFSPLSVSDSRTLLFVRVFQWEISMRNEKIKDKIRNLETEKCYRGVGN